MPISLARVGSIAQPTSDYYGLALKREDDTRAARDLRKKSAQDLRTGEIDLAAKTLAQRELERVTAEDAQRRAISSQYIQDREGAQSLPVGVRAPEFVDQERPSSAPFGPMAEPKRPSSMESRNIINLARVNPDFAESFRTGAIKEREGEEDRGRKQGFEDQAQIIQNATSTREAKKLSDAEKQQIVTNSINWFNAKTNRTRANAVGAALKPPTESQANFAVYGRRMQNAENTFNDLESKGFNRSDRKQGFLSKTANYLGFKSPSLLQQEQAERDFVNATLRRESGAAISPSEFQSAEKQYFPRSGDDPVTIANKKRNREIQMQSFKGLSGNAWQRAGGDVTPAQEAALTYDPAVEEPVP